MGKTGEERHKGTCGEFWRDLSAVPVDELVKIHRAVLAELERKQSHRTIPPGDIEQVLHAMARELEGVVDVVEDVANLTIWSKPDSEVQFTFTLGLDEDAAEDVWDLSLEVYVTDTIAYRIQDFPLEWSGGKASFGGKSTFEVFRDMLDHCSVVLRDNQVALQESLRIEGEKLGLVDAMLSDIDARL